MSRWLIVAGDFTPLGGQDAANHALARYLASSVDVHLVTHRAWPDLVSMPRVTVHHARRPFASHALGSLLLAREGVRARRRLSASGDKALVNGGNCLLPGAANWVHYLHAAYRPRVSGSLAHTTKATLLHRRDLAGERAALGAAAIVICNSERTRRDVIERAGVDPSRTRVIYYGCDPVRLAPASPDARAMARRTLVIDDDRPIVGFVGALGDRRKGFDVVLDAWVRLCGDPVWDADLIVIGSGAERPAWEQRARVSGAGARIRFAGFRSDVPELMAGFDALVHPARYEAYGLSVREALCRGIPSLVSAKAGVAEEYPSSLAHLLITNPEDSEELVGRLRFWRGHRERLAAAVAPLGDRLRARTWDRMAADIVAAVDA